MSIKVSVALCTYNGSIFIEEQLESILKQTRKVDQIIVCDDGSVDDTLEKVRFLNAKASEIDWKIVINDRSYGVIKNFERAINYCNGDIIFLCDQDDIWCENKVEEVLDYFDDNKDALMVFTDALIIDNNGREIAKSLWETISFTPKLKEDWKDNRKAFSFLFRNNNKITGATIAFKCSLKKYIIPIEIPFGYLHDAWIGLIAAAHGGLGFIDKPLIGYRIHSSQYVGLGAGKGFTNELNSLRSKSFNYFAFAMFKRYPIYVFYYFYSALMRKLRNVIRMK